MRRLLLFLTLPCLLAAEDRWIKFTSGAFEVFTDAGVRAGRETMVRLEEFRHALGQIVGEQDLQTPQPVRVLLFKNAKGWAAPGPVTEGRDRYAIVLEEKATVSPAVWSELTRLFLDANTAQMPPAFEHGLVEFFSTFDVKGIQIAVGAPPPNADSPPAIPRTPQSRPDNPSCGSGSGRGQNAAPFPRPTDSDPTAGSRSARSRPQGQVRRARSDFQMT